jgi:hypothetical protein
MANGRNAQIFSADRLNERRCAGSPWPLDFSQQPQQAEKESQLLCAARCVEQLNVLEFSHIGEPCFGQMIRNSVQKAMAVWFTTSHSKEADLFRGEIKVSTNQAVGPSKFDGERVAEQADPTSGISPAQADNLAPRLSLEIESPRAGKTPSPRRSFDAQTSPLTVSNGILSRLAVVIVARWLKPFGFMVSMALGSAFACLTIVTGRWLIGRKAA